MSEHLSRFLLAYDESAGSQAALTYACAMARATGAELVIAHAVDASRVVATATAASAFSPADPQPLLSAVEDYGHTILAQGIAACAAHGVVASALPIHESLESGLLQFRQTAHVDIIIAGTHGRHGIERALLGSGAEAIVRDSDIPVLVVNGHAATAHTPQPVRRALIAVDDSEPSRAAAAFAGRLCNELHARMLLCTVVDSRDLLEKAVTYGYDPELTLSGLRAHASDLLDAAVRTNHLASAVDDRMVLEGDPAETIEHAAMQHNCDLIVMGSHGRKGIGRLILGSVAEAVVRSSARPVLVVRSASSPRPATQRSA